MKPKKIDFERLPSYDIEVSTDEIKSWLTEIEQKVNSGEPIIMFVCFPHKTTKIMSANKVSLRDLYDAQLNVSVATLEEIRERLKEEKEG